MSGYSYPAKSRLSRLEEIEDLGALPPDFGKNRERPPADTEAAPNPVRSLAKRKRTAPTREPIVAPATVDTPEAHEVDEPSARHNPRKRRKEPRDLHRPSSANLPVELVAAVASHRRSSGMSAGDTIVAAIEQHLDRLPALLAPKQEPQRTTGFSARPSQPQGEGSDEITKLFAFRLTEADFEHLDQLVDDLGARDRTHLIREALTEYFKDST